MYKLISKLSHGQSELNTIGNLSLIYGKVLAPPRGTMVRNVALCPALQFWVNKEKNNFYLVICYSEPCLLSGLYLVSNTLN